MAINLESINKTLGVSEKKVQKTYTELVNVFKKNKLNVKEILIVLGNLVYTIGASVGNYDKKGPSPSKLEELYLLKPTIDVALMIKSILNDLYGEKIDVFVRGDEKIDELKLKNLRRNVDTGTIIKNDKIKAFGFRIRKDLQEELTIMLKKLHESHASN